MDSYERMWFLWLLDVELEGPARMTSYEDIHKSRCIGYENTPPPEHPIEPPSLGALDAFADLF